MENEIQPVSPGTILVATWGYSMILSTWVRVVKVSPKSLLVEEIDSKRVPTEELSKWKLSNPGYLCMYVTASENTKIRNCEKTKTFRIYKRETDRTGIPETTWVGTVPYMSSRMNFKIWDGLPVLEDHCD